MSQTDATLQRTIASARSLRSVVRTMKALAAATLGPYETALQSLEAYAGTVDTSFTIFLRQGDPGLVANLAAGESGGLGAIVIGSDQGMVGGFNDVLGTFVTRQLAQAAREPSPPPIPGHAPSEESVGNPSGPKATSRTMAGDAPAGGPFLPGTSPAKAGLERPPQDPPAMVGRRHPTDHPPPLRPAEPTVWVVGERVASRLAGQPFRLVGPFPVPVTVEAIPETMAWVLADVEKAHAAGTVSRLRLYYQRPAFGSGFAPTEDALLPLDVDWLQSRAAAPWPTRMIPQRIGMDRGLLPALVREKIFLAVFQACTRSGASEQMTRLAAMQRAERKIDDLVETLQGAYHQQRQTAIMEELLELRR